MNAETEAIVADTLIERGHHGLQQPTGTPCANCATPLQGAWCHACGQYGDDYHRSAWHLLLEAFEGFFHFDGRLWQTLPGLLFRPAQLTRAYVDGHRMPQVPPLRLVFVVLLLLFLVGSLSDHSEPVLAEEGNSTQIASPLHISIRLFDHEFGGLERWANQHAESARRHPEEFKHVVEAWSERFAFLMLPVAALILSILFVFRREFWLFDHLVFAMHSLAFQGVLLIALLLGYKLADPPEGLAALLLLASPLHLFFHMRGFYRLGSAGTVLRMGLLAIGSLIGAILLLLGLLAVGLAGVAPSG